MDKHSATVSSNPLRIFLCYIVLITELLSIFPNIVSAQHAIDPEIWIEMMQIVRIPAMAQHLSIGEFPENCQAVP